MSHLRPEDITILHKMSSCRKGRHRYGPSRQIGGGILRQVCARCGSVSIDLTATTDEQAVGRRTRQRGRTTGI